ncbi:hypothetical protein Tco_0505647, partial [Tanacetum coccineum]
MDMDCISDLGFLDLELLQLNVVSPLAIKSNLYVAEKLFDQWLSLPETTIGRFAKRDGVVNSVMISSASGLAQQGYKVDRKSVILKSSGQPQNLDVLGLRPRFDQWQGTSSYYSSLVDITWLGLDRTWQAQLNFGGPYNAIMSIDKALAIK